MENSFPCGLVKITFTGCLCIKMCPTPPWFLLLQALSLVWPLWSEIKGIFLLQGCPPMAKSQMLPSHPSPTFCLSSNLSPLGSFKPQIPFFKFFFFLHSAPGSLQGLWGRVAPIPPVSPVQGQKAPGARGCVQCPCPVAVAQRDAENGSLFPVLIAGPGQLIKGSALCPALPAALGCARARPLRADFGVTHKKTISG